MKRILNSIIVAVCAFTAGLAVACALYADGGKTKANKTEKEGNNEMENNNGKNRKNVTCTTAKGNEIKQQKTGKFDWNKKIRIKADKTAEVKPAIAYGVSGGALALAIIIALIVIL
jgi:hypothetical protein